MAGEEQVPLKKGIYIMLMLFTAILFTMFTYFLFRPRSSDSDAFSCPALSDRRSQKVLPGLSIETGSSSHGLRLAGQCDLFSGQWVYDPSGPSYTNTSCNLIEAPQNCIRNGRPDSEYLYWRWKPYGCELPPFNPHKFLADMKDKSWAFIGDSIFRNHIQSMLCFLSKVEEPVEIYHDKAFKSRTWHFPGHNLTVAVIWSPYLVKSETWEDDEGKSRGETQLHVDILDEKWTNEYHKHDYIIFSGGQWFLKTMVVWWNNTIVGCHDCKDRSLKELGVDCPYRKALRTAYNFMASSKHRPLVFFRTWTPDHFEHGEWFSGGLCNRSSPYTEGQYKGKLIDSIMRSIELEEFQKAASSSEGPRLSLLDTFHLSLLRPDGHPGPYRTFHPFEGKGENAKVQNDCLHWCLPGPIDTWNHLIMKLLDDQTHYSSYALS